MRKIIFLSLLFLFCLWHNIAMAATKTQLHLAVNRILQSTHEDLNVGIIIADAKSGKILYTRNPDRLFNPASNLKLFTAYAALKSLPEHMPFQTSLYADLKKLVNGVLNDNIYLRFDGDPSFTSQKLNMLIATLNQAGIRRISGNLMIINQAFDANGFGKGWMWDDANFCYGEPVNGMIVDHNCFTVILYPNEKIAALTTDQLQKSVVSFAIQNHVITANPTYKCAININSDKFNRYNLSGCVNQKQDHQENNAYPVEIAVHNVDDYIKSLIQNMLKQHDILLTGSITYGSLPMHMKPLLIIPSDNLSKILSDMLKPSDNLYANALFKKIGQLTSHIGTWQNSQKAVEHILQAKLNIHPSDLMVVDGSGASRYNLVTPRQIWTLLNIAYKNQVFVSALPISGVDGTLEYRMKNPDLKGRVLAKTGSMTGISSLSGYIRTKHNQTLIFVIMINHFLEPETKYRAMQDKICQYLAEQKII